MPQQFLLPLDVRFAAAPTAAGGKRGGLGPDHRAAADAVSAREPGTARIGQPAHHQRRRTVYRGESADRADHAGPFGKPTAMGMRLSARQLLETCKAAGAARAEDLYFARAGRHAPGAQRSCDCRDIEAQWLRNLLSRGPVVS